MGWHSDDEKSIEEAKKTITEEVSYIDVLINNAALVMFKNAAFHDLTSDTFMNCFRVNVLGTILVTRALLPLIRNSNEKKIINISSSAGSHVHRAGGGSVGGRRRFR